MTDFQKQCLLNFLGYDTGGIGNGWGPKSRNAVECCQEDLGIPADGVWGPQTDVAVLEAVYTYNIDAPTAGGTEASGTGDAELDARFEGIRYWTPEEFRCQCNGQYCDGFPALPDRTLLELVDDIRHKAGRPGHRTSGLRCEIWNSRQPGAAANSKHKTGKALDFWIEGMSGAQLLTMALADHRTSYAYIIKPGEPYVHVEVE